MFCGLFSYPFLAFLWHHQYPLVSGEALMYLVSAAVLAWALASLAGVTGKLVGSLLFTLCVLTIGMVHFDLLLEGLLILFAFGFGLAWFLGHRLPLVINAVLVAMILGAALDSRLDRRGGLMPPEHRDSGPPPVVHLVMDAFAGPYALSGNDQPDPLGVEMMRVFETNGFSLFRNAYSHYSSTIDSITHAFDFEHSAASPHTDNYLSGGVHQFGPNQYFQSLAQNGYRIRVYQNEDMPFCQPQNPAFDPCWSQTLPNLESARRGVKGTTKRLRILLSTMIRQSRLATAILGESPLMEPFGVSVFEPDMVAQLLQDIASTPRGTAFFAHLLLPHSPYVFSSDCQADYDGLPAVRFSRAAGEVESPPDLLARRVDRYTNQALCALRLLQRFFDELRDRGLFDDAIIIVHGDHGPQILRFPMRPDFAEHFDAEDFRRAYSILYAVKLPQGSSAQLDSVMPLELLLGHTTREIVRYAEDAAYRGEYWPGELETEAQSFVYMLGNNPMQAKQVNLFGEVTALDNDAEN